MLSRSGGAVAFQKIVSTVDDLPSPLDAQPGERIIVRKTQEVYGLDATTRMWTVIGTLKKVGGKKPEELAAHIDSDKNPHKISLQDALTAGQSAKVDGEILITGKGKSQLSLLSGGSALRLGADAGASDGVLWVNAGRGVTALRIVDGEGKDLFVVDAHGGLRAAGAAQFSSYEGPAAFDEEITAKEGVKSADGFDLVLSGDKAVVLNVGGKAKAYLDANRLNLSGGLGVKGDIILDGAVRSSLLPATKALSLGDPKAPWKSLAAESIDAKSVSIQVAANSKTAPFQVLSPSPGDTVILTPDGKLGIGTADPEARLDVRGEVRVDGDLRLSRLGLSCGDAAISFSDGLTVKDKGAAVLHCSTDGTTLSGSAKVGGDLTVGGKLALGALSGLKGQEIRFNGESATYVAQQHTFVGPLKLDATGPRPLELPGLAVDNGDLLGKGDIKGWSSAQLSKSLKVGKTSLTDGTIEAPDGLTVRGPHLEADNLHLRRGLIKSELLRLEGTHGKAEFSMGGPICGLTFEGKQWEVDGISRLGADKIKAKSLDVSGPASLCGGAVELSKKGMKLSGELTLGNLAFKTVKEVVELDGQSAQTKFEIPAGVRVEAVVVKLLSDVSGARFLQVGDLTDQDRYATPSTDLKSSSLIRGLNHWSQGRAVQRVKSPVIVLSDAPATGKLEVTVHYVDPAAL